MSTACPCGRSNRRYTPHSTGLGWPWPDHPACEHSLSSPTSTSRVNTEPTQPSQGGVRSAGCFRGSIGHYLCLTGLGLAKVGHRISQEHPSETSWACCWHYHDG